MFLIRQLLLRTLKKATDPSSFMAALDKIEISYSEALIVENAPLGVEAAHKAGI